MTGSRPASSWAIPRRSHRFYNPTAGGGRAWPLTPSSFAAHLVTWDTPVKASAARPLSSYVSLPVCGRGWDTPVCRAETLDSWYRPVIWNAPRNLAEPHLRRNKFGHGWTLIHTDKIRQAFLLIRVKSVSIRGHNV